jgi:NADH-quinone oxidoreductase subunit M
LSGYLYQQTKTLEIGELGGLLRKLPFIGTALVMAMLAGCGLPGFANFVGEVMIFFGAFKGMPWFVVAAAWGGLIIGAVYMLRAVRNVLHGPVSERWNDVLDANAWRKLPFVVLLVALLVFGCFPRLLTDRIKPDAEKIVNLATRKPPVNVAATGRRE